MLAGWFTRNVKKHIDGETVHLNAECLLQSGTSQQLQPPALRKTISEAKNLAKSTYDEKFRVFI